MKTSIVVRSYKSDRIEESIVRKKGQITVPSNVRNFLDLQEGDKLAFIVDENERVEVVKKPSVVAQTAGALKGLKPVLLAEKLRVEAERAIGEDAISRAEQ